jgi:hypothetical protein
LLIFRTHSSRRSAISEGNFISRNSVIFSFENPDFSITLLDFCYFFLDNLVLVLDVSKPRGILRPILDWRMISNFGDWNDGYHIF